MKRYFFSAALVLALGVSFALYRSFQGPRTVVPEHLSGTSAAVDKTVTKQLPVGERASYSLRWMGLEVGRSETEVTGIETVQGRPAYHIVVKNRTHPVLDLVFKVRDEYHSYLDVEDLKTLRFEKDVHEGNYRAHEEIDFDHGKGEGAYHSFTNGSRKTFKFQPGAVDAIAAFYKFRLLNISDPGLEISLSWDEKSYTVKIPAVKQEVLKNRVLGRRDAIQFEPYLYRHDNPYIGSSRVLVWVTAAEDRIPLQMQSTRIPFAGSVNAVLTEYTP